MVKTDVDGKTTFVQSSSSEIGKTVVDRLSIIRDNENDNSCIRLSSNYLLYSGWYYLKYRAQLCICEIFENADQPAVWDYRKREVKIKKLEIILSSYALRKTQR